VYDGKVVMKKILFLLGFSYCVYLFSATHYVTNVSDRGPGSLRQAILDANADSSAPRIVNFDIDSEVAVQTIQPLCKLPALTASDIVIDGTTQSGWTSGNPVIVLDGGLSDKKIDGLTVDGADNCVIQGLVINNGFLRGIAIINNANHAQIYECFVGTDVTGMVERKNDIGIMVSAFGADQNNNTVIGAPSQGNLISGNKYVGIWVSGNVNNILIQSNKIGTDKVGSAAISNLLAGIAIGTIPINTSVVCRGIQIGVAAPQSKNLISGNGPTGAGILVAFESVIGLAIEGNVLGLDVTETFSLPNATNILTVQSVVPPVAEFSVQNNNM
jgi:hypothetical protein